MGDHANQIGETMTNEHFVQPVLIRFLGGSLPSSEASELFGHLAYCDECHVRLEALRELRANPETVWDELLEALRARRASAGSSERAKDRAEQSARGAHSAFGIAVRLVVDRARGVATIAAQSLDALSSVPGLYRALPVSGHVGVGDPRPLAEDSGGQPRVEVQVIGPGIGSATIVADARRNAVSVLLIPPVRMSPEELLASRHPRAVLRNRDDSVVRETPLERVEGAAYLLAEFEQLEDVEWVLGLDFDG